MFSRRMCNFIGFLISYGAIAVAYFYFEKTLFLNPCPLCYAQRFAFGFLGFWFLIATFFPGYGIMRFINGLMLLLLGGFGASLSIRHVYLQYFVPKDQVPTCGPDVFALFERVPFMDAIIQSLTGTGECAETQWTLFGIHYLSIPSLGVISFIFLALWGVWNNWFRSPY